ncbi:Endonuclease, Uma2 family (restriction endonuclease fold) [Lentibacillus persicus]|uniref:Endonuclease, Uma2 family (Restriction endonuclease fold) n=1 Tax=Lentibacillus persicus TaxID=640948 RepID=A0A1I1XZX3_9BACI|nr:Uma2 family endonuclease [Lentibacillus persicus]SFE12709.1 Endonuclease, Uma2 family (restriction endonuclease fold) [Lentibacillus persicus]
MRDKNKTDYTELIKETNLTYDDYASIDDGNRYELVNGQLELMSPAPSVTHQMFSFQMQKKLTESCESDYIILNAPIDLILADNEVRQPDLILIHRKRLNILRNRGVIGPPDLVIEILSPSTLKRDKIDKLNTYANFGIPEYWIAEPKTGILEQYFLHNEQYSLIDVFQEDEHVTSPHVPCISFTMADIMKNIPDLD